MIVHPVVNAQGECFVEFGTIVNEAEKLVLESTLVTTINDPTQILTELASIVQVAFENEEYHTLCGKVGFRLTSTEAEAIVTLDETSVVSLNEITDESLVGIHTVSFEAFLVDIDPEALFTELLDLVLTVEVVMPVTEPFIELGIEGPISTTTIATSYQVDFGVSKILSFDFASALTLSEGGEDVELGDLEIKIISNTLPGVVSAISVDNSE